MGSLKELGGKFSKVYYDDKKYVKLVEGLKFLANNRVYVGIPEDPAQNDRNEQTKEHVTNAQLLFLHTNGSEKMGIPARQVLEPAIEANQDKIDRWLKKAVESNLTEGNIGMMGNLEKAGMAAMNAARQWFADPRNGWAPNSPFTLYGLNNKYNIITVIINANIVPTILPLPLKNIPM